MKALALIEHADRELDLVCLLKALLKARHGVDLQVAGLYVDAPLSLADAPPEVVLTPFFYSESDSFIRDYVAAWPQARFINLAWEQLFYPAHQATKRPRKTFARKRVLHLAWTREFVDFQTRHGVSPENLAWVGHSLYALYGEPYRRYFDDRRQLAADHGLAPEKRWVFVPENYRWAFLSERRLLKMAARGLDEQMLLEMHRYCVEALAELIRWCDALGHAGDVEVILRPRPSTPMAAMAAAIGAALGDRAPSFHLNRDATAREWTMASDVVVSSYSTVLIEGALAGKRLVRASPLPLPQGLRYDWCDLVPEAASLEAFLRQCLAEGPDASHTALAGFARETFFPVADPVSAVVDLLAREIASAPTAPTARPDVPPAMAIPPEVLDQARRIGPAERLKLFQRHLEGFRFILGSPEKDVFGPEEVEQRTVRWRERLGLEAR